MIIILSLFIICSIFAYAIETSKDPKQKNLLIFSCLLFLTFVSGTRLVGGSDYFIYRDLYYRYPDFSWILSADKTMLNYEKSYLICQSFFYNLGFSFYGFCLFHAAFFYFALWKGLSRYTEHFGIVILIFLYKLFFYNTFISMRQSITVACFFLMIPLIENKKWLKYFICCYIVSRFHNGAYMLFVLYPLAYIKLSKKLIFWLNILFLPTMAIGMLGIDVLGPIGSFLASNTTNEAELKKISGYFDNENLSPIGIFHTLEYYLIMFLFYINIKKLDLNNPFIRVPILLFLCLIPLFTLFRGSEILTREKDYFTIFYAVILGFLIDVRYRKTLLYIFVVLLCAFGYYRYVILFDDGAFLAYKSWLFESNYSIFR